MNWYKESKFESIKSKLIEIKGIIAQESIDTKAMVQTYYKWLKGEASPQEIAAANSQAKDLLKDNKNQIVLASGISGGLM